MFDLSNKTVFITGIGSGIGLATAQVALKIGATVYGTVFSEEQSEIITGYIPSECIYKVDVKNSDEIAFAVDDAAKCSGKLDGIVAVAGILSLQEFTKTDDAIWHNVIDTNLSGSFSLLGLLFRTCKSKQLAPLFLSRVRLVWWATRLAQLTLHQRQVLTV